MKTSDFFLYLSGLFSTFYLFQFKSIPFCLIFALLFSIIYIARKCICFKIRDINLPFFYFIFVTIISGVLNHVLWERKFNAIPIYVYIIILVFYYCVSNLTIEHAKCYVKGLKTSCTIHIIWCFFQYFAYNLFGIDINRKVFVEILGIVENASRVQNGKLIISGICFHPSNLIPTLLISVFLFDKWYIWGICFIIAFFSSNSTLIVCLSLAILFKVFHLLKSQKIKIRMNSKILIAICAIFSISLFVLYRLGFFYVVKEKYHELLIRIIERNDDSTLAHLSYYVKLPEIYSRFSLLEILFGWGIGRSGNVFSEFYHLYTNIENWCVESDPMNFIYSVGLVGAFSFYLFLFSIIKKARKFDAKTYAFMYILIICGFLYAVQYIWVVLLEVYILAVLRKKQGLFTLTNKISILDLKGAKK